MTDNNLSIGERLAADELALANAQNDAAIQGALMPFGYDDARMQEGRVLYQAARDLVN